jgi:parallel beta-helix repeat protein
MECSMKKIVVFLGVFLFALAANAQIKEIHITCDATEFAHIYENYDQDIYINAVVKLGNETWEGVRMRLRGDSSREFPKKSLKFKFDAELFSNGKSTLNLNADYLDKSMMHSYLASYLFNSVNYLCFRSEYYRVYMNGKFHGLFISIENMDDEFFADRDIKNVGSLYKATRDGACLSIYEDFEKLWEKKTNENTSWDDLKSLTYGLWGTEDADYYDFVQENIEYDNMVYILSMNMLLANGSTYYHNYYMYNDINGSGKWRMIPWDMDKTFETYGIGMEYARSSGYWIADNAFLERAIIDDKIYADIRAKVYELGENHFHRDVLFPLIDSLEIALRPSIIEDKSDDIDDVTVWETQIGKLKAYIQDRAYYLTHQMDRTPKPFRSDTTPNPFIGGIRLNWHPSASKTENPLEYIIHYGSTPDEYSERSMKIRTSDTTIFLTDLPFEGKYYWAVQATDGHNYMWGFNSTNTAYTYSGTKLPCEINTNTTLTIDNSPYFTDCDVIVKKGVTLKVDPGVHIQINDGHKIEVNGKLLAVGTEEEIITISTPPGSDSVGVIDLIKCDVCTFSFINTNNCRIYGNTAEFHVLNSTMTYDTEYGDNKALIGGEYDNTIVVDNCFFKGTGSMQGVDVGYSETDVSNSVFDGIPDAIEIRTAQRGSVINNIVRNSHDDGIDFNSSKNIDVIGNILYNCADKGISVGDQYAGPSTNILIKDNIIYNCNMGIAIKSSSEAKIINNTFYNNNIAVAGYESSGTGGVDIIVENSIISACKEKIYHLGGQSSIAFAYCISDTDPLEGEHNLNADPKLTNPANADFTLQSDSPCIDVGDPQSGTDPDGTRRDLGAIFFNQSSMPIVINEINYNSHPDFETEDWVEIYNPNEEKVDISGWAFKDGDDTHEFVIPSGTILQADGYLVLAANIVEFRNFHSIPNVIGDLGFGLSSKGELIRLFDAKGTLIDSVLYDDKEPWPIEPDGDGSTLELKNPDLDNALAENWAASEANGTPGARNSRFTGVIPHKPYQSLSVHPNPCVESCNLNFENDSAGLFEIEIYNAVGILMLRKSDVFLNTGSINYELNTEYLPIGFYNIVVRGREAIYKTNAIKMR